MFGRIIRFGFIGIFLLSLLSYLCLHYIAKSPDKGYKTERDKVKFRVDSSFTYDERMKISSAMKDWSQNTIVDVEYYIDDTSFFELFSFNRDGVPTIYKAMGIGWRRSLGMMIANKLSTAGVAVVFTGDIFIFISGAPFERTVKHEIGHILSRTGVHSNDPSNVMFSKILPGKGNISPSFIYMINERSR